MVSPDVHGFGAIVKTNCWVEFDRGIEDQVADSTVFCVGIRYPI